MKLSKSCLKNVKEGVAEAPGESLFGLPEKVIQFGTGVLLRGLPDYFIDKANKQGLFNGRIVVVKSTEGGDLDAFDTQDGLYTHCIRGIADGQPVDETVINASISRVISASRDWALVMECATNPDLSVVISNTTEVGIVLVKESIHLDPPSSFPGKLLALLYRRFKHFQGNPKKGMVIIPTELIPDNGKKLESIVLELAHQNGLETAFIDWLEHANCFCSSLVDRIVPGKLPARDQEEMENKLGYTDELMILSEVYRLWAIESDQEQVREILSFGKADDGVVIVPDINVHRELKLRLLNGSHTFACALAFLAGFTTVKEAMDDPGFLSFIRGLMLEEIIPAITNGELSEEQAQQFAARVLDRYRNPYIEHRWISISFQYTGKMALRNVPLILAYHRKYNKVPRNMSFGFAAYLLFMKCRPTEQGTFEGVAGDQHYTIRDESASFYAKNWNNLSFEELVQVTLSHTDFWQTDLAALPGFGAQIVQYMKNMARDGAAASLQQFVSQKTGTA